MVIVKAVFRLFYLFSKVPWITLYRSRNINSSNVLWIYQSRGFKSIFRYIRGEAFLNDMALAVGLNTCGVKYKLVVGRKIGKMAGKNIFYTISKEFNYFNLNDHSITLVSTVKALEEQGNLLCPSSKEAMLWENKAHMHQVFDELGIRSPETMVIDLSKAFPVNDSLDFPLLIKDCHSSGSQGLTKVEDYDSLIATIKERRDRGHSRLLMQALIDMRRDLRVILINNQISLFYWRINNDESWRPTSTSWGSSVDFDFFPENCREEIINTFRKLDITTGAFDIAWDRDDTSQKPYFLEVSPAYMPNPKLPKELEHLSYSEYKMRVFPKPQYVLDYLDKVFELKQKVVEAYINKHLIN